MTAAILAGILAISPATILAGEIGSTQEPASQSSEGSPGEGIFDDTGLGSQDEFTDTGTCTVKVLLPEGDGLAAVITGETETLIRTEGGQVYIGGAKQDPSAFKIFQEEEESDAKEGSELPDEDVQDSVFDDGLIQDAPDPDEEVRYVIYEMEVNKGDLVGISAQGEGGVKDVLINGERAEGFKEGSPDYVGSFEAVEDTILEQNIRRAFPRLYRRRVSAVARHIVP